MGGICLAWELVGVSTDGLRVVGRTEVAVDEVGRVVEFHHCFWLPALIGSNVFLQPADDEVVVGMFLVGLNVGWVMGRHLCANGSNYKAD